MRRRLLGAVSTALVFAVTTLGVVSSPTSAQTSVPDTNGSECRELRAGDRIDAVVLVDESQSMREWPSVTEQVRNGIRVVIDRLDDLSDQGITVRLSIIGFGSEGSARAILPLSDVAAVAPRSAELQAAYNPDNPRTDYRAGLAGVQEQLRGSTANCRILLWFTDGIFDVGPNNKDSQDAPRALEGVCGGEDPLAGWFALNNVQSYVIVTNEWNVAKWESEFANTFGILAASLSVMQAVTGDDLRDATRRGEDEREVFQIASGASYRIDPACAPFLASRSSTGEIRLDPGDLDDIFDVLISKVVGDTFATEKCPVELSGPVDSDPMPDGLLLSSLRVYNLNGPETDLTVTAMVDGQPERELVLDRTRVDGEQLRDLPGGWQVRVEGGASKEVCISYPEPRPIDNGTVDLEIAGSSREPFEANASTINFSIDWTQVDLFAQAQAEGRDLGDLISQFGLEPGEGEEGWTTSDNLDDVSSQLALRPTRSGDFDQVELWVEVNTGVGTERVPVLGRISPPVSVNAPAGAPSMTCSNQDGQPAANPAQEYAFNGGETPTITFESEITCIIEPPDADTATISLDPQDVVNPDDFDMLGVELVSADGAPLDDIELEAGAAPIEVRLVMAGPLDNRTWKTGGTLMLNVKWRDFTQSQAFDLQVDLVKRSDQGTALLATLIIGLLAALVSLAVFRLMNSFVKIPPPDNFFVRSADVRITVDAGGSPVVQFLDLDQLDNPSIVSAERSGLDLRADRFAIHRVLPSFFRPFGPVTTRLGGPSVVLSSPAEREDRGPGSFSQLILLGADVTADSDLSAINGRVAILHPRRWIPDSNDLQEDTRRMAPRFMQTVRAVQEATPVSEGANAEPISNAREQDPVAPSGPPRRPAGGDPTLPTPPRRTDAPGPPRTPTTGPDDSDGPPMPPRRPR